MRPHTQKPDHDNLVKSIQDACQGIVYADDSQVWDCRVWKYWTDAPLGGVEARFFWEDV